MADIGPLSPSTFDVTKLRGELVTINSQSIRVYIRDENENIYNASGTVVITDGGSGYAKGCLFTKTDATAGNNAVYINVGTTTSSNFDLIQDFSGGGGGGDDLDGAYSNGQSINVDQGAMTLNDATTGAADTFAIVQTGAKSGDLIDISVDAALTGNAIALDMNLGIAAAAIFIDNGGTARTASDILVTSDSTGAHSVIDINASGSGAVVGLDFTGSSSGSPGGQALSVTFDNSDNLDTEVMQVTTGTGARSVMFDLNFGHTDSGTTSHIFDIDMTAILDSNVFDFASSAACTGNFINVNLDNAVAMTAIHLEGSGVRTQPFIELITDSTSSASLIDISVDGAITGTAALDIDMNAGLAANAIFIDAGAGVRTADLIAITDDGSGNVDAIAITASNTGSGSVMDINVTGIRTGNIIDIAMSGAATSTAVLAMDMDAAVAAAAIFLDAGNAVRTADLIDVTFDGSGNVGFIDLDCTNTGSGNLIDVDVSGVHTGNILDLTYSSAASTGDAISVVMATNLEGSAIVLSGAGARTDDLVKINDSSTGNSHIFDINMSGIYTGNVLDVTFATAAATGNAIDLNMGTNVAGMAISVASAATGTSGEGSAYDVAHTGNLAAGADLMRLSSTGSPSATSNILAIEQATGAGSAGAFGLYINCTGTNVEGIKVDAGDVVIDEDLTVSSNVIFDGTQSLSGAGAVNVTQFITEWTTTAADAGTLADGTEGQLKCVTMIVDGGDGTLTPTNFANGATITFNDVGDTVLLLFTNSNWVLVSNTGTTIA